jgi:hypothetical protein
MLRPSSSHTSDLQASRDGSGYTTGAGIPNVTPRLLQLSAGRPPTGYARVAAACTKRGCAFDSQPQLVGSNDTRSTSAALVARAIAYPAQIVYHHAVHKHWTISSLQDRVCSDGRQQGYLYWTAVFKFIAVCHAAATNEIWRTGVFVR